MIKKSKSTSEKKDIVINTDNQFNNALAVIHNTLIRAQTKWSIEETKLFLMCISQVTKRDNENWVTLKKKDVNEKMGIDSTNTTKLKNKVQSMMRKSMVSIENQNEFDYGFIFTRVKSDRKTVSAQINKAYLPLLEHLSEQFTEIYIDNVIGLKSKHAISLYMYLSSWFDKTYLIQKTRITKTYIHKCFNLKPEDYWRNYGSDNAKIDWNNLEKRVIKPAIEDINNNRQCDIKIIEYKKLKKGREIQGYQITWGPITNEENKKVWSIDM